MNFFPTTFYSFYTVCVCVCNRIERLWHFTKNNCESNSKYLRKSSKSIREILRIIKKIEIYDTTLVSSILQIKWFSSICIHRSVRDCRKIRGYSFIRVDFINQNGGGSIVHILEKTTRPSFKKFFILERKSQRLKCFATRVIRTLQGSSIKVSLVASFIHFSANFPSRRPSLSCSKIDLSLNLSLPSINDF